MVRCFSLQARRVGHTLAAPHPLAACTKQRMVCPCGVSSVALFTLPAAFAKFNALPAPKKKAAALFLVPVVAVLTALCVLQQTLPPLASHPFSRVWATRAAAVLTPCGLSLQVSQAWLRLLLLRVCPDPEHGPWLCGSLAPGNQERSGFWLLAAVREDAGQEGEALERCAQLEAREVARPSQTALVVAVPVESCVSATFVHSAGGALSLYKHRGSYNTRCLLLHESLTLRSTIIITRSRVTGRVWSAIESSRHKHSESLCRDRSPTFTGHGLSASQ